MVFQRYVEQLPSAGKIIFFDRSWYNRVVVEPVRGFCTKEEHERFLRQVSKFEYLLFESGVLMIKLWFSIDIKEQKKRLEERTHCGHSPWVIVKGNDKQNARLESIRYVLSKINYSGKAKGVSFDCNPEILQIYSPSIDSDK